MNRAWDIIKEIIVESLNTTIYFLTSNMRHFANILNFCCPYLMYFIGQYVQIGNFKFVYGLELIIPIVISMLTYFLHSAANKTGKGNACPVPAKRFTEVSDEGEVSIENDRLQELLLYMADLEDWMERKNIL